MTSSRFVLLSDTELNELTVEKVSKKTDAATKNAFQTFVTFCKETEIMDPNDIEKQTLISGLKQFYAGCQILISIRYPEVLHQFSKIALLI